MSTASVPNTFASAVTATGLQLDTNYNTIVAYLNEPLNRNNYAADSGNTNTIVLTFSPAVSAYSAGLEITFKAANTNSGAAVINANALGNKNFIQPGGSALSSGQIEANGIYKAAYNGSAFVYIGQNVLAASQGDMETATSAITFVSPNAMKSHPGVAKAWGFITQTTGSYTLAANYGVSGVARAGTGTLTVTWTSAFSSTAYAVVPTVLQAGGGAFASVDSQSTIAATIIINSHDGGALDASFSVAAFGDLP